MDGRSTRWEAHNDAQRERIIAAAIALYDEGNVNASLQEIGARAGLSRSVLYRQFEDRRAVELAMERHVLAGLLERLDASLVLAGTIRQTLHRVAATYIDWAAEHPRLHQLADLDAADGPLGQAIAQIAGRIAETLVATFRAGGAEVSEADVAAADPLAHGLVGAVFATVRRWLQLGAKVPDREHLTDLVVESAWAVLDVRLRAYGHVLDPDGPIPTGR
ncbi:TetR/AcrR family transcriptional regulator [Nocardioides sp. BP30]|uniref:TetR/AcrR family transcriptional regulator n=1 Tax=Nocardioides sp. BP30 TaxID=3036374 RepID=UPI002468AED1|nr:TetR/AcrR family transcriptional regulator [Nocardioides sp. BP30]WGL52700.1 TetR/AcrR family transcriptional regulator [Nocardioides sp. BP30]